MGWGGEEGYFPIVAVWVWFSGLLVLNGVFKLLCSV